MWYKRRFDAGRDKAKEETHDRDESREGGGRALAACSARLESAGPPAGSLDLSLESHREERRDPPGSYLRLIDFV